MEIKLTRGKFALVDAEDMPRLSVHKWHCLSIGYAARSTKIPTRAMIYLHREVIGAKPGQIVDHINGDKLDNRRSNLRIVTKSQNQKNVRRKTASGYLGVRITPKGRWQAYVVTDSKWKHVGNFDTATEAALARDSALIAAQDAYSPRNFS